MVSLDEYENVCNNISESICVAGIQSLIGENQRNTAALITRLICIPNKSEESFRSQPREEKKLCWS